MTDVEQTLEILREVGPAGIHSFELGNRVGTIRAAARVNDLRNDGHNIVSEREKLGNAWGVRYYLVVSKPEFYDPDLPLFNVDRASN